MPDSATIIDLFNERFNKYRNELNNAKELMDFEAQHKIEERLTELKWCIQQVQAEFNKDVYKYPDNTLESICQFPKYKGTKWKDIIEENPGYVEFCLNNVKGFRLDRVANQYLIDIQNA